MFTPLVGRLGGDLETKRGPWEGGCGSRWHPQKREKVSKGTKTRDDNNSPDEQLTLIREAILPSLQQQQQHYISCLKRNNMIRKSKIYGESLIHTLIKYYLNEKKN